jgi:RNA polymerase sigma-70 factor (ECF subfamily)
LGGLGGFNGRARFSTWLYRVAMNTVHGFLARQCRSPVTYCSEVPEGVPSRATVPDSVAMQSELESAIEAALQELPPKLRAAVVLMTLEQIEVGEAARIEGCSRATMYWRIHEARKRLKQRLEEYLSH